MNRSGPTPPTAAVVVPYPTKLQVGRPGDDGRTVEFVGLGGADTDRLLKRVADQMPTAVAVVVDFWGNDWSRDIMVVAAGSDDEFRELVSPARPAGPQWVDVAAAAVADSVDLLHGTATGQRIVFGAGAAKMTDGALRIVVRHELFHFASRAVTALDAPRWLTEGVADFVGRPETALPGRILAADLAQLPADADFDKSGPAQSLAYDRAWWFARFVAAVYGPAQLRALYLRAGGAGHPDPDHAMRQVLGADQATLLARWRQWLAG